MTNKEILDNTVWSFSTLHMYEDCPYSFYCKKFDTDKIGIQNFYAEVGGICHDYLANIFLGKSSIDDTLDEWVNTYYDQICCDAKEKTKEEKYNEFIDYLSTLDLKTMDNYKVLEIETESTWKIGKYNMIGFIDLLLQHKETGEIVLVDHKSAGKFLKKDGTPLKNMLDNFNAYKKQMYLYCIPIKEKYSKYPSKIVWNHFFSQDITVIPFIKEELKETKKWAKKTIDRIYKDVEFEAHNYNDEKYKHNFVKCRSLCNYREDCEYIRG